MEQTYVSPRQAGRTALSADEKRTAYRDAEQHLSGLLADLDDPVAVMASAASVLFHALPQASFVGFYRVVAPGLLRVGPYQGPVACIDIPFDRGVCGAAARQGKTQLVPDVDAFPGHIACDAGARSEIVVPLWGRSEELVAVLDLDSHRPAAFDEVDQAGLESIARLLREHL
jgi:L-methionine (R)-S-oxide reductase